MKTARFGIVLLAILLGASGLALVDAPGARAAPTRTFVLYGDAAQGWGFTNTSISQPGPTIVVNAGDNVSLQLFSNDSVAHTWFIDYNNNTAADSGEPASPQFSSATVPQWFNFTADPARVGTWTYRCAIHPNAMHGLIVILAAPTFVLYGSASAGWGTSPTNLSNPGPDLTVTQGQTVTFELVSQDGQAHTFFIDLNANNAANSGEPQSPTFGGPSNPAVIDWSWTVNLTAGTYSYLCGIHTTAMKGTLTVLSSASPASSPPDYSIYAAVIVVVAIVAMVAVVAIRRRTRSPPLQPPLEPQPPA